MADSKISALPASTTPLAGTEVLPIVQSSTTKQVSVANLTAGRAIGATSIQFGSGTVLSTYEEGTWTPVLSASVTAPTVSVYFNQIGVYTKIGNMVIATCYIRANITNAGSGKPLITGLPFSSASNLEGVACGILDITNNASSSTGGWFVSGTGVYTSFTSMTYAITNGYFTFTVSYKV